MIRISKKVMETLLADPSFQKDWVNEDLKQFGPPEEKCDKNDTDDQIHHKTLAERMAARPHLFFYFS